MVLIILSLFLYYLLILSLVCKLILSRSGTSSDVYMSFLLFVTLCYTPVLVPLSFTAARVVRHLQSLTYTQKLVVVFKNVYVFNKCCSIQVISITLRLLMLFTHTYNTYTYMYICKQCFIYWYVFLLTFLV